VRLDVHGHPLHTRALSVMLVQRDDERLSVHGAVLDLRKQGFVPVGGDLQGAGIIHHMLLDGVIDPATATLEAITAHQPSIAFEASPATGGESCRDPIGRVDALAGTRLDASFGRHVSGAIGGPRGCSHLATLAHLLGSTALWALERDRLLHGAAPVRPAGQRVYRRDLIVDGHEAAAGRLALAVQLTDLHFAPAPPLARPMDRFAGQLEVRALAEVELTTFTLATIEGAERRRGLDDLEQAPWRGRDDALAGLAGLRLGAGVTAELIGRLGNSPADRPILDALLMLAPTVIQCSAALSEAWAHAYKANASLVGMGGLPDSCWMWRRDGALTRAREAEGGAPPGRLPG
jgi:hypothetical protein